MAVDLAAPVPGPRVLTRGFAVPARWALAALVGLSAAVRFAAAFAHVTPYYFPDEYLYPALARGIAQGHGPVVRGTFVHFPALFEPLLTAPFWIPGDPLLALRLTEALHAVAMSLAAVPVFLLARRLRLSDGVAVLCALVAIAFPDLVYASFTLSDPIAYPLVVAAVYAGVVALDTATPRAQAAFFAFAALATFARVQYAALPVVFAVAALVLDHRRAFARYRVSLVLWGLPAVLLLAVGPGRLLGAYSGVTSVGFHPTSILRWMASDAMVLVYASGVVLVPGALVALFRPRTRAERAFSLLTLGLTLALLAQAGFVASFDSHRVQERYVFPVLALAAPAFALAWGRAARAKWLLAAALVLLSVRVPLSGFAAAHGKDDSPTLFAVLRLEQLLTTGNGALAIAVLAGALALTGAAARPKLGLALAVLAAGALAVGAQSYDARNSRMLRTHDMPADAQWVDHAGVHDVALVEAPGSIPPHALEALWWNSSVTSELVLGSGAPTDHFGGTARAHVLANGTVVVDGKPVTQPLLVQTYGSQLRFAGADVVARGPAFELVRPRAAARLALLADGLYSDGWLARDGALTVWRPGAVRLVLSLPQEALPTALAIGAQHVVVRPGRTKVVVLAAKSVPHTFRWHAPRGGFTPDARSVSVRATLR